MFGPYPLVLSTPPGMPVIIMLFGLMVKKPLNLTTKSNNTDTNYEYSEIKNKIFTRLVSFTKI